jgi:N-carbamoylputrescine amidase
MKVTVCQLRNDADGLEADWQNLVAHVREEDSGLVLLPEMPFYPWLFWRQEYDPNIWNRAVGLHDSWIKQLKDLAPAIVVGTRPLNVGQYRYNEGFSWDGERGIREVHSKYYLPNETGFWEASWYEQGGGRFNPAVCGALTIGMLICTEMWFMHRAREYGQAGVHLLVTPRATEPATAEKWLAGGRAAAVIAGAYGLSSCLINDRPESDESGSSLGGRGWIVGPEGEVLAETTVAEPFVTVEIDPALAEAAKSTYPRYIAHD